MGWILFEGKYILFIGLPTYIHGGVIMFGNISQPTKLIIVCTDDTREYGDYLMQLISLKDDTQDNAVGLKDGSVEAVL